MPKAPIPTPDRDLAMRLLAEAVAAAGKRGKAGVAARLGVSRCYVSRVLSPSDPSTLSAAVAQRIIDRYHVVPECPVSGLSQPRSECRRLSTGPAPTHNPLSMRFWRACQACPHKPDPEVSQ